MSGNNPSSGHSAHWLLPGLVLALGTFAMGTDSFVLAGILPQIGSGLHVSEGSAGQVVTAFALTYAVSAPVLAAMTSRISRKALMAIALVVFVAANIGGAAAPDLPLLLVARVAAALGAAMFTPTASAAVVALVGPQRRGVALSVILGGLAVGTVFGVPAGTALGQAFGWQASLLFIAAVSTVALVLLLTTLPRLAIAPGVKIADRFRVLANARILSIISVGTLATGAGILVYTYIALVLASVAHVTGATLTYALLTWGVGASVGAFGSGWLTDRYGPNRTLVLAIAAMAVALLALGYAASAVVVFPLMLIGGAASWSINAPLNHRLTGLAPALPAVVISFNSSGTYLGQAVGALSGGLLLSVHSTATTLCLVGAAGAAITLGVQLVSSTGTRVRSTQKVGRDIAGS
jgi:MFS transporter, DHA1 family, inner membrane transport protein